MPKKNVFFNPGKEGKELVENERRKREVLKEVSIERHSQDLQWGGPKHDDSHSNHDWIAIIAKFLGRAVAWPFDADKFRESMIKIAAVAVAAAEWVDRRGDF